MGAKSSRMFFFREVKVRVDEKWTWGEGGQKKPKMDGRPLYTVPKTISFLKINSLGRASEHT